jgi:hypothetical protein
MGITTVFTDQDLTMAFGDLTRITTPIRDMVMAATDATATTTVEDLDIPTRQDRVRIEKAILAELTIQSTIHQAGAQFLWEADHQEDRTFQTATISNPPDGLVLIKGALRLQTNHLTAHVQAEELQPTRQNQENASAQNRDQALRSHLLPDHPVRREPEKPISQDNRSHLRDPLIPDPSVHPVLPLRMEEVIQAEAVQGEAVQADLPAVVPEVADHQEAADSFSTHTTIAT